VTPSADTVLAVLCTAALAGASTYASARWAHRAGGLVSAFPAIVGPLLILAARQHGAAFAARLAEGTLLGTTSLAAFAVAYGRAARGRGPHASLALGWVAAGAAGLLASGRSPGSLVALGVAAGSIGLARALLPPAGETPAAPGGRRRELAGRMVASGLLVWALSAAAARVGPTAGGVLAALPVLASVLAARTHREHGTPAVLGLLHGTLRGMVGFAAFCAVVALLAVPAGPPLALVAATLTAVGWSFAAVRPSRTAAQPGGGTRSTSRPSSARITATPEPTISTPPITTAAVSDSPSRRTARMAAETGST
jgi:hypothetical protein